MEMLLCIDKKTFITNIFVFSWNLIPARLCAHSCKRCFYHRLFSKTTWISHCQPWADIMLGIKFPEFEVTTGRGRLPPFPPRFVFKYESIGHSCRHDFLHGYKSYISSAMSPGLSATEILASVKRHRFLQTQHGYCLQNANNEQKSRYCL